MAKTNNVTDRRKSAWAHVGQKMDSLEARIRELEAELQVRDNMGNEVLRILREATGKRDFHSEMEAAEWAARMIIDLQTQLFLEKQSAKEAMSREAAAVSREIGARAELAEARRYGARLEELYRRANVDPRGYLVFRPIQLPKNADWDGVTCKWDRDIFNAAIDAAMKEGK